MKVIAKLKNIISAAIAAAFHDGHYIPHQPVALVTCGACGALVLNPDKDRCSMCGKSIVETTTAKTVLPILVMPGTAIWTSGRLTVRSPSGQLVIERHARPVDGRA